MTDWNTLIPEITTWRPPIGPEALAAAEGRYPLAIGYLAIFWPDFCTYDDMVLRGNAVGEDQKANIQSWLDHFSGNREKTEAMLNHFHLLDLQHPGLNQTATKDQICFIGRSMRAMWAAKLVQDFPKRNFRVDFYEGNADNLIDYQITFYQTSPQIGSI